MERNIEILGAFRCKYLIGWMSKIHKRQFDRALFALSPFSKPIDSNCGPFYY